MMTNKKRAEWALEEARKRYGKMGQGFESDAFLAGIKFADENPKYTKQDFISQAKEFLRDTFHGGWPEIHADMSLERLLWEFDKWMA